MDWPGVAMTCGNLPFQSILDEGRKTVSRALSQFCPNSTLIGIDRQQLSQWKKTFRRFRVKRLIVSRVMHNWTICLTAVALLCGSLAIVGCGGVEPPDASSDDQKTVTLMNTLAVYYNDYLSLYRGRPPKDGATFRKFLKSRADNLKQYEIEDLEQLFNSPRDGQPFTIIFGKRIAVSDSPGTFWAAYEQTGVDGKRMAVRTYGGVDLLDADQFAQEFQ